MYSIRLPFTLDEGFELDIVDAVSEVGGYPARVEVTPDRYILTIDGLENEALGLSLVRELQAGFLFLLLHHHFSASATFEPETVNYYDEPQRTTLGGISVSPADGICSDDATTVYRTSTSLHRLHMGRASFKVRRSAKTILAGLDAWFRSPLRSASLHDPRLIVAADLYSAHFSEESSSAKFLTLVMALESLCEPLDRPEAVRELMAPWKEHVANTLADWRRASVRDPAEIEALEALGRELIYRSTDSIKNQLRRLIRTSMAGDHDVESLVKLAGKLYDIRSQLLHKGTIAQVPGTDYVLDAKLIVERVLRARWARWSGGTTGHTCSERTSH